MTTRVTATAARAARLRKEAEALENLARAQEEWRNADEVREAAIVDAVEAGLSLRAMAAALDMSASGLYARLYGRPRRQGVPS